MYYEFLKHLDSVRKRMDFKLWAYVVMPNHVHLLIYPENTLSISAILYSVKHGFSHKASEHLRVRRPTVADKLVYRKGNHLYNRFWQVGGGYDRNISGLDKLRHAVEYIHFNPVRKGLVRRPTDWRWSSAGCYEYGTDEAIAVDRFEWW